MDRRVVFDFEVDFSNGGGIQGQGFRLDIGADGIADQDLADYIVRDMRLLMVGEVRVLNKRVIEEAHKRTVTAPRATWGAARLVDLSHPIEDGMITYPGLPGPSITAHLSREDARSHYAEGTEFLIGSISMVGNTGTYLDSPFHRYADGADLADLDLARLADLDGVVITVPPAGGPSIGADVFRGLALAERAVLVHTGWDRHWRTDQYGTGHPFLDETAARYLADARPALLGIDSLNIDDTADGRRPSHSALLRAGIPIVEHLSGLAALPESGFRFFAVPPQGGRVRDVPGPLLRDRALIRGAFAIRPPQNPDRGIERLKHVHPELRIAVAAGRSDAPARLSPAIAPRRRVAPHR